jgi:hypothetical protein
MCSRRSGGIVVRSASICIAIASRSRFALRGGTYNAGRVPITEEGLESLVASLQGTDSGSAMTA